MAFIRFKTADDARKCLDAMNHKEVFGRTITITYANKIYSI
jgi:RNA recognition motif-containing protein